MKLPVVSGEELVKILSKIGFVSVRQKGSHVIMRRDFQIFSVPLHKELKQGTLLAILKQAGITKEEFSKYVQHY